MYLPPPVLKTDVFVCVSIIVPCYNEEVSIPAFFSQMLNIIEQTKPKLAKVFKPKDWSSCHTQGYFYELIFVNDGSKDKTLQALQNIQLHNQSSDYIIKIINFSRNFGKESAIIAGLEHASGEGVILLDADLQDPPSLIPQMLNIWLDSQREIKVIYAKRTNRMGENKIRAFFSEIFYKLSNFVSEVKIESGVRDFRLMDRVVASALLSMPEYHRFSKAMFEWVGFKRQCLEYEYIPHFKAASSWNFWKLFKYGIEGIISFSTLPLRIAFVLGLIISTLSVVYGSIIVVKTLLYGNLVAGYPSLIVVISFIGGIELIILGVIGEYIARIYEQVKMRPTYILEQPTDTKDSKP